MGEDPGQIRQEIEATRERMAETADALAYKANVPARAKETAQARREALLALVRAGVPQNRDQSVGQAKAAQQALVEKARGLAQNQQQAVDSALSAALAARQQPGGLAIGLALGALLGLRKVRGSRRVRRSAQIARAAGAAAAGGRTGNGSRAQVR